MAEIKTPDSSISPVKNENTALKIEYRGGNIVSSPLRKSKENFPFNIDFAKDIYRHESGYIVIAGSFNKRKRKDNRINPANIIILLFRNLIFNLTFYLSILLWPSLAFSGFQS